MGGVGMATWGHRHMGMAMHGVQESSFKRKALARCALCPFVLHGPKLLNDSMQTTISAQYRYVRTLSCKCPCSHASQATLSTDCALCSAMPRCVPCACPLLSWRPTCQSCCRACCCGPVTARTSSGKRCGTLHLSILMWPVAHGFMF